MTSMYRGLGQEVGTSEDPLNCSLQLKATVPSPRRHLQPRITGHQAPSEYMLPSVAPHMCMSHWCRPSRATYMTQRSEGELAFATAPAGRLQSWLRSRA